MPRVLTDFNDIDDEGRVMVLVSAVEGPWNAVLRNRVLLYDDGEHESWGTVVQLDGDLMVAEIDWDTWGPAGRYQVEELGGVEQRGGWMVGWILNPQTTLALGTITSDAIGGVIGLLNSSGTPSPPPPTIPPLLHVA